MNDLLFMPREWLASAGEIGRFAATIVRDVWGGRVLRFFGEALRQAGILIVGSTVVIAFSGIWAFNYVFTQTLLATHPEILVIR